MENLTLTLHVLPQATLIVEENPKGSAFLSDAKFGKVPKDFLHFLECELGGLTP